MRIKEAERQRGRELPIFSLLLASCFLLLCFSPLYANDEAKALFDKAKELEKISDSLTEKAEKACYWKKGGGGSHACMQKFVNQYNQQYGAGAFELLAQLNVIRYTGVHYKQLIEKYPGSASAAEADFTLLSRHLVGSPDEVFPRVKDFLQRHPSGEWGCKGQLLLGRLNQDIWWIHKKWSWVLYNWKMSEEDLIVKAEPYRQEGLKLFEKVSQSCKGEEKNAASAEYKLLKDYKDDGKFYGIINETMISETQSPR